MTLRNTPSLTALWRRLCRQLPARAALAWLLLALVVAPTLGRLHQVEHAGALEQMRKGHALQRADQANAHPRLAGASMAEGASTAAATSATAAPATAVDPFHVHDHGLLSLLLGPHAPVDCLVLDQLALGDALHSAPAALPAAVPALAPAVRHTGRPSALHIAQFQARGPPAA